MSNPFDNKIKESLENFEMPYDANAWAAFEKQLPQGGGAATGSSQLSWKAVALVAVLAASVATIWYVNTDKEANESEPVAIEQSKAAQEKSTLVEENASELIEPTVLPEESEEVSQVGKPQIATINASVKNERETETETTTVDAESTQKADDPESPTVSEKTTPSAENPTPEKTEAKPLTAHFDASSVNACAGEEVRFINQSSDLKAKMTWDFGDGTLSNELNPSHSYVIPGNYQVILRTEKDSRSADRTVTVTVNPAPVADIDASLVRAGYEAIPYYRFETVLQPNETAVWKFSDGSIANAPATKHLFRKGKSNVELTVSNNHGCTQSETWNTEHFQEDLLAYDAFSPDGDGTNDGFMPGALPDMNVAFEMVILDQKGQEVHRTSNASDPWNGKLNNHGSKLDAGTYFWTVVLKEEILRNKTFTGTIKLIR